MGLFPQQVRAAYGHRAFAHQPVGFGARPVSVAKIDRRVEVGVGKQEGSRSVGEVDRHFRVLLLEVLEPWQQPLSTKGRYYGQLDHVGALLAHHRQGVPFNRIELGGYPSAIGQSGFCQLDPTARAAEQFDAQKLFQAGDLPANRALGQRKLLGGLGKAFVARCRLEADQGGRAGYFPSHVRQPH
ncbi:hypothetical protein D3C86_1685390 [compost metagenome]